MHQLRTYSSYSRLILFI